MANAYKPGGGYLEGYTAQEENIFRRTDCHEALEDSEMAPDKNRYTREMSRLINGEDGRVYLDTENPRVCFRGPEVSGGHGYELLPDDEVFHFYELRSAAVDLGDGSPFDPDEARRRIRAQLDTLREAGVRRAVFSAFGFGAFRNPASEVARLYREEIQKEADGGLEEVVFAVFHAGYGPDNFAPFTEVFGR
jgi:hypothetical protein